jgi:hypothetical protein
MYIVVVPEDISITVQQVEDGKLFESKQTLTFFSDFLVKTILRDQQWGQNSEWLHAAKDIKSVFAGKSAKAEVTLSRDLYKKLLQVIKTPTIPYNPMYMLDALVYIDCIEEAKQVEVE